MESLPIPVEVASVITVCLVTRWTSEATARWAVAIAPELMTLTGSAAAFPAKIEEKDGRNDERRGSCREFECPHALYLPTVRRLQAEVVPALPRPRRHYGGAAHRRASARSSRLHAASCPPGNRRYDTKYPAFGGQPPPARKARHFPLNRRLVRPRRWATARWRADRRLALRASAWRAPSLSVAVSASCPGSPYRL